MYCRWFPSSGVATANMFPSITQIMLYYTLKPNGVCHFLSLKVNLIKMITVNCMGLKTLHTCFNKLLPLYSKTPLCLPLLYQYSLVPLGSVLQGSPGHMLNVSWKIALIIWCQASGISGAEGAFAGGETKKVNMMWPVLWHLAGVKLC